MDPAKENGEYVTITNKSQLLSITPEQAKKIKYLRIENMKIDFDFGDFFLEKCNEFDSLYFYKCEFVSCALFNVNYSDVLGCVNCALTSDSAWSFIGCISQWDYIKTLDLSKNKFGEDPEKLYSWMFNSIFGVISIGNLILTDNGFSEEWKSKISSCFNKFTNLTI